MAWPSLARCDPESPRSLETEWRAEQSKLRRAGQTEKLAALDAGFAKRFLDLAKGMNGATRAQALLYAIYADPEGPSGREALEQMASQHAESPEIEVLLGSYPLPANSAAQTLFRRVAEEHPKRDIRAKALLTLAEMFKDYRPAEAQELYTRLLHQFADVRFRDQTNVREKAEKGLVFVKTLSIGQVAPDIAGLDVHGKPFRLSEYRGKVVLMTFCGEWCSPCRAFRSTERALLAACADKPFVVISVAGDTKDKARQVVQRENIPWRTVVDHDARGPIAQQWQIQGWPNIYLLDRDGKIREHWIGSPGEETLKACVARLVGPGKGTT